MPALHYRTCHLCEAMCGVVIEHEGRQILSVRGDDADPLSRGHICPKATALQDIHEDPDRLRRPLKRVGETWQEIPWEQAFDEVAERIQALQRQHGRHALGIYQGNPTVHSAGSMTFGQLFVQSLGTKRRFSATSLDQLPHMLASLEMFGHQLLLPVIDVDRTAHLLIFGANPVVSNGSLLGAPDMAQRIKDIRKRGGRVVVLDPRKSETAELADRHHFVRPGTDALVLLAMLQVLTSEQRLKPGRLTPQLVGLEQLEALAAPFKPETVAAHTGLTAAEIRTLAVELSEAPTAAVYGRMGVSVQAFGGLCAWLINLLNIVTGNLDREGGVLFATPAIDAVEATAKAGQKGHAGYYHSRVRGLPEFGGELPAACLAEEIDTPGEGQLKGLVTSSGNPVLSSPNGKRLEQGLAQLDLMVSIDIYINETTRHAHYILPPTFGVERSHYDLAFHLFGVKNTTRYAPPMVPREPDQRHDWEIFNALASRLGKKGPLTWLQGPLKRWVGDRLGLEGVLDLGLRFGPYGSGLNLLGNGLTLKKLKEAPHGLDFGPLKPRLPERLFTSDKRIQLVSERYVKDLERLQKQFGLREPAKGASEPLGLVLISRRELRSNNSWLHNSRRMVKGKNRCTLHMHPHDAAARGLQAGQDVRVTSAVGEVRVPLQLEEGMMPGVVSLPHGYGHHRPGMRMQVAASVAGVSINDLTDPARVDELSGNAALSGVPVDVRSAS
ncbi:MAG: molybdopterin oxidoreductase family protein [Myxococcota bacterium]